MIVDDPVRKVDPVKGIEDAGRHLRAEAAESKRLMEKNMQSVRGERWKRIYCPGLVEHDVTVV